MKRPFTLIVSVLVLFTVFTRSYSQITPDSLAHDLQNLLDAKINAYGIAGAAVTIVLPGEKSYTLTSGIATGINDPVDTLRRWHWASSSKPLTGFVILQMMEEGLLDLDDPIGKYLDTDTIPNVNGSILIRDLLRHTAGLREIWDQDSVPTLWNAVWNRRDSIWCPWQVLSYMPPPYPGRTTHKYASTNSYLLSFIIEAVSGKNLETVFRERIFDPLGMKNSTLSSCKSFDMAQLNGVWSGRQNRSSWSHTSYLSSRAGNSALVSTPMDVARFYRKFYQDSLLTTATMDSLRVPAKGSRVNRGSYGCADALYDSYGFETNILEIHHSSGDTLVMYGHSGNGVNNSVCYHWKKEDITLILVVNDFTATNTLGALYSDLICEIHKNLPIIGTGSSGIEVAAWQQLSVYPNPAHDFINIEVSGFSGNDNSFILRDMSGRIVRKQSFKDNTMRIPVSHFEPGVYVYEFTSEGRSTKGKLVIN